MQSLAEKAGLDNLTSGTDTVPAPAKRRKVSDQQLAIDPECGPRGTILKSADGERVYSVTLNQVQPGISK